MSNGKQKSCGFIVYYEDKERKQKNEDRDSEKDPFEIKMKRGKKTLLK